MSRVPSARSASTRRGSAFPIRPVVAQARGRLADEHVHELLGRERQPQEGLEVGGRGLALEEGALGWEDGDEPTRADDRDEPGAGGARDLDPQGVGTAEGEQGVAAAPDLGPAHRHAHAARPRPGGCRGLRHPGRRQASGGAGGEEQQRGRDWPLRAGAAARPRE